MPDLVLRRADARDADFLAQIHLAAWRAAYAGLVPDAAAERAVAERATVWRASLGDPASAKAVFLAGRAGAAPSGFAACGPADSRKLAAAGFSGEFYAIYLLPGLQGAGAGRTLMQRMAAHLYARGLRSAGVWVLRDNVRACRFYESLGARETGIEGVWPVGGLELPDLAYGWRDLSPLAHQ